MSIIDQEIERLWTVYQIVRRDADPDSARLLLKTSLLYLHMRGLQSGVRVLDNAQRKTATFNVDEETEKTWGMLRLGYKYGSPDLEHTLFKKSLQQIFLRALRDSNQRVSR